MGTPVCCLQGEFLILSVLLVIKEKHSFYCCNMLHFDIIIKPACVSVDWSGGHSHYYFLINTPQKCLTEVGTLLLMPVEVFVLLNRFFYYGEKCFSLEFIEY